MKELTEPQQNMGLFPSRVVVGTDTTFPSPAGSAPSVPVPPAARWKDRQAPDPGPATGWTRVPRPPLQGPLTLDFLYPRLPGDEDDHEVTGQTSQLPPELKEGARLGHLASVTTAVALGTRVLSAGGAVTSLTPSG